MQVLQVLYITFSVFCERFEVIMYNQVSRCLKTTGRDHSVCTILSGFCILQIFYVHLRYSTDVPSTRCEIMQILFIETKRRLLRLIKNIWFPKKYTDTLQNKSSKIHFKNMLKTLKLHRNFENPFLKNNLLPTNILLLLYNTKIIETNSP